MKSPLSPRERFDRAIRREGVDRPPVWLMRQAGRFDPHYQRIRHERPVELEDLFRDPVAAARITLLPRRFGVDALILFQDILTPLGPMGVPFVFRPGPMLAEPMRSAGDLERLRRYEPRKALPFVADSIRLVREMEGGTLPLLGFAGAPLTLLTFIVEGGSPSRSVERTRRILADDPAAAHRALQRLADTTADYLRMQIEAGVDAVQLFESVADLFTREEYEEFAHPYHRRIIERLGGAAPVILFVKEQPFVDLMVESGAAVLSVGQCVDLAEAQRRYGDHVAFQGNVDNQILRRGTFDEIDVVVRACIEAGGRRGHILNLNHGVLRDTPVENVQRFIDAVRESHE